MCGTRAVSFAGPIPDAYWAEPGRLLAGPHPFLDATGGASKSAALRALVDAGVRTVLDLRTPAEPPSVRSLLGKVANDAAWIGIPIFDGAAPSIAELTAILDVIDAAIARKRCVYVHCQGGRGRTGTVVACFWIRHGRFDPEGALEELRLRRRGLTHGEHPSPETGPQLRRVRGWRRGE